MARATSKPKSLRGKFVRVLLVVSLLMSVVTTSIVAFMSAQSASQHFAAVQGHIQDGIISKGKVLTQQHALALRSLALDNAFLDMQRLVERAVKDDQDLVYGLFVIGDGSALAKSRRGDAVESDEPPAQDAWRSLGLREDELLVKSPSVKRVTRLGQDLLEVAVPVVAEDGETLGTIRYGLSTVRMHEALARAKSESDARLWRSVLLMAALVSLVTGLGLVLSRAQAVHITEPVGALRQAAEALANGDRSVRVNIQSGDELSLLGTSFNRMVDELDSSYGELERMNRTLEQKVGVRTAELALKNRDMRLVLDNVDQGFISLSPNGVMAGEHSAIVAEWFGAPDRAQPFWEYVERVSSSFAESFRIAWSQVEDGFLPVSLCLSQLPTQLSLGQRTWSFRYLLVQGERGEDDLEGVLMAISDVTDRLAREREEAEHGELMEGFKRVLLDRSGFSSFLEEARTMIDHIVAASASEPLALRRSLHTLKGNAGMMGLSVVAGLCHELETQIAEEGSMQARTLSELRARWKIITDHIATFLGQRGQRVIEVPEAEYAALVSRFSKTDRQSELLNQLLSWQLEPASKPLSRLGEQARALARRLGHGEIEVDVSGDVRLDRDYWAPFFTELVHVIRNAVDHGLEPQSERLSLGKRAQSSLALTARVEEDRLTFEVTDDGRGIDWSAIVERAKAHGLPHSTHAELVDALCTDGITTRLSANQISGRGVGMASFRQRLNSLAGRLEVRSTKGGGTTWLMHFGWPVKVQLAPTKSVPPQSLRRSEPVPVP
jgi:two-component system chemotaxis sensor kinase CheA